MTGHKHDNREQAEPQHSDDAESQHDPAKRDVNAGTSLHIAELRHEHILASTPSGHSAPERLSLATS
jgi:hypothetical protein